MKILSAAHSAGRVCVLCVRGKQGQPELREFVGGDEFEGPNGASGTTTYDGYGRPDGGEDV